MAFDVDDAATLEETERLIATRKRRRDRLNAVLPATLVDLIVPAEPIERTRDRIETAQSEYERGVDRASSAVSAAEKRLDRVAGTDDRAGRDETAGEESNRADRTGPVASLALTDVPGVGSTRSERLRRAGYASVVDVADATPSELGRIDGISAETAQCIRHGAKELRGDEDTVQARIASECDASRTDVADAYASIVAHRGSFEQKATALRAMFDGDADSVLRLDGPSVRDRYSLYVAGFETVREVAAASLDELTEAPYVTSQAESIRAAARAAVRGDSGPGGDPNRDQDPESLSGAAVEAATEHHAEARETLDSLTGIPGQFLSADQQDRLAQLRARVEAVGDRIDACETLLACRDGYQSLHEALVPYGFDAYLDGDEAGVYPQYMPPSDASAIRDRAAELASRLDRAADTADRSDERDRDWYGAAVDRYRRRLERAERYLEGYEQAFVDRERERYPSVFEDIDDDGNALSDEQAAAVVRDDEYNLVVAGAGSGKTVTLIHRVAYLTRRADRVPPEDVIALTYTGAATDVMSERLRESFGLTGVETSTLHSLGRAIVEREAESVPETFTDTDQENFVKRFLRQEPERDEAFERSYYAFLRRFYDDFDASDAGIEVDTGGAGSHVTLREELVRSASEKAIADFLMRHRVEYEYDALLEWVAEAPGPGQYRATFHLPDHRIVLAHRPIEADGSLADWAPDDDRGELAARIRWERDRFGRHDDYRLVETYEFEATAGRLREALEARLVDRRVPLDEMSYEAFVESAFDYQQYRSEIVDLFASFVRNARELNLAPAEVADRVADEPPKARAFGDCVTRLYRAYCERVDGERFIDFPGMIHDAVEYARAAPETYRGMYDQILVDEFQDISNAEVELLRCLVGEDADTTLFCVGDDWQSIYSFSGSDVTFFLNFADHFEEPTRTVLTANYRSPPAVVAAGDALIANNDRQIDKETRPQSQADAELWLHELPLGPGSWDYDDEMADHATDLIERYLDAGADPADIMVLSRTTVYEADLAAECAQRGIETTTTESGDPEAVRLFSVHKAKGKEANHVIIVHAVEHRFGFPMQVSGNDLLEPVRLAPQTDESEERRIFYVALTRSEATVDVLSSDGHRSRFVDEIESHLTPLPSIGTLDPGAGRVDLPQVRVDRLWEPSDRQRQTGLLADWSGVCRFTIWEGDGTEPLSEGQDYELTAARVGEYGGDAELTLDERTTVERTG